MNILDIAPYAVYPPKSGGSTRIHNLNVEVSEYSNVFSVSSGIRRFELQFPLKSWTTKINENYVQHRYVNLFSVMTSYISDILHSPPIFSGDCNKLFSLNPRILNEWINRSDLLQIEHPWQFEYIFKKTTEDKPIILVEHNVECDLFEQDSTSKSALYKKLLGVITNKEQYAVENADAVLTMSQSDTDRLAGYFKVSKSKFHVIPNGVNTSEFNPSSEEEKNKIKKMMGLSNKKVILFTGYKHGPNIEAVTEIKKMSQNIKNENVIFLVAGRVGDSFSNEENVLFTGYVDEISNYFKVADIAINPMISGSGTNLKMLEYLASGIPTITTDIGARGLDVTDNENVILSEIENFPENINHLIEDPDLCFNLKANGRKLAEEKYDWKNIAQKVLKIYDALINR